MIVNQNQATSLLNSSKRSIKNLMDDREQIIKKHLLPFNYGEDPLQKLITLHKAADAADDLYLEFLKKDITAIAEFENQLAKTVKTVESHVDLLKLALENDPQLQTILVLEKRRFFYDTDQWLSLALKQYQNILSSGNAQVGLMKYGISINHIRNGIHTVLETRGKRKKYHNQLPDVVTAEKKRQHAFVTLAHALEELETICFIAHRDTSFKKGDRVLQHIGMPFLERVLSNRYIPTDQKMVKDSSIT
jgi:hypothetical protein